MPDRRARIARVARDVFGWEKLRPGQAVAVESVASGRDTLVVMPTGSGKSAIYQIAGVMLGGPTVVVSPLIALQRDQVGNLDEVDAGGAATANSSMGVVQRRLALAGMSEGRLEFLFLAPEQFDNEEAWEAVEAARPSLFVVDEAHCISAWGHDFRPEYLRLAEVVERLGRPTTLALTATAAPPVRDEIVARLGLRDPAVLVRGFDRPEIGLEAERFVGADEKERALLEAVVAAAGAGIVYAATRRDTERLAAALAERGVRAAAYHAGLPRTERHEAQERFMGGDVDVVVATTAFGMGIDKPDVRYVFHHSVADSLDSYYQEIGRAGRDGSPARAVLFYRPEDLGLRRFFAGGRVDPEELERVALLVERAGRGLDIGALAEEVGLPEPRLEELLRRLEDAGALAVKGDRVVDRRGAAAEAAEEAAREAESHRLFEQTRIEMMRAYAETSACRREALLTYFGEPFEGPCANCDNCRAGLVADERGEARPFEVQARVTHASWGEGTVMRYEGDTVVVLFDDAGYRSLHLDTVEERGLLRAT